MNEPEKLRARAARCRASAREYASETGAALLLLADELEQRARRLEVPAEPPRAT